MKPRIYATPAVEGLNLSNLTLHCHLHPLQAANCCRKSRLVVHEDDLKWVKNYRKLLCMGIHSKTLGCRKNKSVFRDVK